MILGGSLLRRLPAVLKGSEGCRLRMAPRIATDRLRSEHGKVRPSAAERAASPQARRQPSLLSVAEGDSLIHHIDEAPGPEQVAAGHSETKRLVAILDELPRRRREIFISAWVEERSHQEIGREFGLSLRSVWHELMLARRHCLIRLKDRE